MKIIINDRIIIYLNNEYLKYKNYDISKIEEYFKSIFQTLKYCYNLEIYGYYEIDVYIDKNYGIVIEMEKDDIDFECYDQIDMRVTFHNQKFLYQIEDIEYNKKIYKYKNKYYIKKYNIEYSIPIYKTDEIFKYAKIIEIKR